MYKIDINLSIPLKHCRLAFKYKLAIYHFNHETVTLKISYVSFVKIRSDFVGICNFLTKRVAFFSLSRCEPSHISVNAISSDLVLRACIPEAVSYPDIVNKMISIDVRKKQLFCTWHFVINYLHFTLHINHILYWCWYRVLWMECNNIILFIIIFRIKHTMTSFYFPHVQTYNFEMYLLQDFSRFINFTDENFAFWISVCIYSRDKWCSIGSIGRII